MTVKGWCPGAWRPMMSGDGMIVRIRPRQGQLDRDQILGLCALAQSHGNGLIDLTSRANLQLRGVAERDHEDVLVSLFELGLLDATAEDEDRRNIITTPMWQDGDLTARLYGAILDALPDMPKLPAKMGIALDTGPRPLLHATSADFRFERAENGQLILRADATQSGKAIKEADAPAALVALAHWFVDTGGAFAGRMAKHVRHTTLPQTWQTTPVATLGDPLVPGPTPSGFVYGAPFGRIEVPALSTLVHHSNATALRTTPWRCFLLEGAQDCEPAGFATQADDPLLGVHACPGAPACASATVDTRDLARRLARPGLHISGCAKGCAYPHTAACTLVGRDGTYDLVENGCPWDEPSQRGLSASDLVTMATTHAL